MTIRKLTDAQVKTMIHILAYSPNAPTNLERFPTLRMMLENGIIENLGGKLHFNTRCPENAYQYVVPLDLVCDGEKAPSFNELEKAGLLKFNPSSDAVEGDTFYFYDTLVFANGLAQLGCIVDIQRNEIIIPPTAVDDVADQVKALVDAYEQKYSAPNPAAN